MSSVAETPHCPKGVPGLPRVTTRTVSAFSSKSVVTEDRLLAGQKIIRLRCSTKQIGNPLSSNVRCSSSVAATMRNQSNDGVARKEVKL